MSNSLRPHESQHARPPCPSPTPGVYSNTCPLSRWCHPAISSSVVPFSSCPQSLPAAGSFPMSQLFTWGGQSIGVSASASVLPTNTYKKSKNIFDDNDGYLRWYWPKKTQLVALKLCHAFGNNVSKNHEEIYVIVILFPEICSFIYTIDGYWASMVGI